MEEELKIEMKKKKKKLLELKKEKLLRQKKDFEDKISNDEKLNNLLKDLKLEVPWTDYGVDIAYFDYEKLYNSISSEIRLKIARSKDIKLLKNAIEELINEINKAIQIVDNLLENINYLEVIDTRKVKINDIIIKIEFNTYINEEKFLYRDEAFATYTKNAYLKFNIDNKFLDRL